MAIEDDGYHHFNEDSDQINWRWLALTGVAILGALFSLTFPTPFNVIWVAAIIGAYGLILWNLPHTQ